MQIWWHSLSRFEMVYWIIAVPSTLVLLLQLLLACIADFNIHSGDVQHHDGGVGHFQYLTVRNVVAFFCMFGWSGLMFNNSFHLSHPAAIALSFLTAFVFSLLVAMLFWAISRLASPVSFDINDAVGKMGTVYINVPANHAGPGKVNVVVQGRTYELNAQTNGTALDTGTTIIVKEIQNSNLIVERA